MSDREKVIKGLSELRGSSEMMTLISEAIALLKEQPDIVRCKNCKYRSFYCTEATDGTTLYTCHHPCANDVPRPLDWFCADGKQK